MAAEYARIQRRASNDPGTAGDQGEENWAALLRDWLPRSFEVVTKGRILSTDGRTSPQVDVLVLSGAYPRKLLDKKLYLASDVIAVFECKTTLKSKHILEVLARCAETKSLYPSREGTPYLDCTSPLFYGLLSHSHVWTGHNPTPRKLVEGKLTAADLALVLAPRLGLDLLCVSDLCCWSRSLLVLPNHEALQKAGRTPPFGEDWEVRTGFIAEPLEEEGKEPSGTPIGALVSYVTRRLAWEHPLLRPLAEYYGLTNISGSGQGLLRHWPIATLSGKTLARRGLSGPLPQESWGEWNLRIY